MATEAGGLTNTPMLEQVFVNPDHSSQVLYQLSELWRDKKLCDATIEVGPVKVYVHRLVLLAACPYLLTVGGQHEVSILEVKLPMTVGLEGLNIFLTYLYDGVLHLTSANLRSVEKLTKILKVTSIQKFCQEFRDSNKETGTADKITTDYSLKMTNSSLQIIFSEIQNEMKRESAEPEIETTPSKRPRMNLDKLSAALQKKSSQSDVVKDSGRGHSVSGGNSISNVASSGPSEIQHDDRDKSVDPLLMHVKEEPMSDYDDEDDTSFSEDTSESQGYSGTTDFVRQAPYDTRPFPDEEAVSRGSKMVVALPPPPSLQKRPSLKRKSFHPSAQHTSQTSETDSGGVNEDVNPGDIGTSGEGGVDATKVLKNIVKSMPEMAMNLGTSSEIGEDNKPRKKTMDVEIEATEKSFLDLSDIQREEEIDTLSNVPMSSTPNDETICKTCGMRIKQKSYSHHMKKHEESLLKCAVCSHHFKDTKVLEEHRLRNHSNDSQNICNYCGKSFKRKSAVIEHIKIKHEENNTNVFRCNTCSKVFTRLKHLQNHLNVHSHKKPYKCSNSCGWQFSSQASLKKHSKECNGLMKHQCKICFKLFNSQTTHKDHFQSEHDGKRFVCNCGNAFKWREELRRHRRSCQEHAEGIAKQMLGNISN